MSEKYYIDWNTFHQDVKQLAARLKNEGRFDKIVAISRGGLLPAGILAYELNIRHTEVINILSYDEGEARRRDEDVEILSSVSACDEHTLIVDDLSDSGRTCRLLKHKFPSAHFASVYVKAPSLDLVDSYSRQVPEDWIVFPWD